MTEKIKAISDLVVQYRNNEYRIANFQSMLKLATQITVQVHGDMGTGIRTLSSINLEAARLLIVAEITALEAECKDLDRQIVEAANKIAATTK